MDARLAGTWQCIAEKPEGRWTIVWSVAPDGAYRSTISGPFVLPDEVGQFATEGSRWSIQANSGRTDGGTFLISDDLGSLALTGQDGTTTAWKRLGVKRPAGPIAGIQPDTSAVTSTASVSARARQNSFYQQGLALKRGSDFLGAAIAFSKAIEQDSGLMEAYYERGVCLIKYGTGPGNETASRLIPQAVFGMMGRVAQAVHDLTRVIKAQPGNERAWCMRGVAKLSVVRLDDAIADFTEAIRLKPNYGFAYGHRAIARIERFEDAGDDLAKFYALEPASRETWERTVAEAMEFRDEYKALQEALQRRYEAASAAIENNRGDGDGPFVRALEAERAAAAETQRLHDAYWGGR